MNTADADPAGMSKSWGRWTLVLLILVGACFRVAGAWWYRYSDNPDYGIAALMAKHMAEGRDFPAFFYGQAYMGSLEPAVSAVLCRLFGCTGFVVCLGTALFGVMLLPLIYAWAREAGGRTAGLWAAAYGVLGTGGYFHYLCSPRGGYAAVLALGVAICWQSSRLASRERVVPGSADVVRFAGLGFLAGLGVWTDPLVVPAILASALLYVLCVGRRAFTWRLVPAIGGFALGSLPMWIWNAQHGWQSFLLTRSFGGNGGRTGGAGGWLMLRRLQAILNLDSMPFAWQVLMVALYVALLGAAAYGLRRSPGAGRQSGRSPVGLVSVWLFVLVFCSVFALSSFARLNTPRYMLPMVPAIAVLTGVGTVRLSRRLPFGLGCLPMIALIGAQAFYLPDHWQNSRRYASQMSSVRDLAQFLRRQHISTVVAPYRLHALNFLLNEEFCFVSPDAERYPPYSRAAEESDDPAVLQNALGVDQCVGAAGGEVKRSAAGGVYVFHAFRPPSGAVAEIEPTAWVDGKDPAVRHVSDRDADTEFRSRKTANEPEDMTFEFKRPTEVCGFRLLCAPGRYPMRWQVFGRSEGESEWRALSEPVGFTSYYWSGPRLYWGGAHFRQECRFAPVTVNELRLRLEKDVEHPSFALAEARALQPRPDGGREDSSALDGLTDLLRARGIRRLYADRWLANAVDRVTEGRVWTSREPSVFSDVSAGDLEWTSLDEHTALAAARQDAPGVRACLAARDVAMRETVVGPWVLFDFEPGRWEPRFAETVGLRFLGFSCLIGEGKKFAVRLLEQAEAARQGGAKLQAALALAEEAVRTRPGYVPAREALSRCLREAGRVGEAERLAAGVKTDTVPIVPAEARFSNGVRLLGISSLPSETRPGETFRIRYFWRCPRQVKASDLSVFVHFVASEIGFQDDHPFLEGQDTSYQPYPEVFVEERTVRVPAEASEGTYRLNVGLIDSRPPHRRYRVTSDLPQRLRAVTLPVDIHVRGGQEN